MSEHLVRPCRRVAVIVAASWLAACGGNASVGAPDVRPSLPASAMHPASAPPVASVSFLLRFAARPKKPSKTRQFIDPSTQVVRIYDGASNVATLDLAHACVSTVVAGTVACTVSAGLPVGSRTYTFEAFSIARIVALRPNSVAKAIVNVSATGPNVVAISLHPVPVKVSIALAAASLPKAIATNDQVIVSTVDEEGGAISGTDTFADVDGSSVGIVVATDDAVDAGLSLNGAPPRKSVTVTSAADVVTLAYTGTNDVIANISATLRLPIGNVNESAAAQFTGGGFTPIVGTPLTDQHTFTAMSQTADGSAMAVAEGTLLATLTSTASFVACSDLSSAGTSSLGRPEDVVITTLGVVGGKLLGMGIGRDSQGLVDVYPLDLTTCGKPILGRPIRNVKDLLPNGSQLAPLASTVAVGGLWEGDSVSIFQTNPDKNIYEVTPNPLSVARFPLSISGPDGVFAVCGDDFNRIWWLNPSEFGALRTDDHQYIDSMFSSDSIQGCASSPIDHRLWFVGDSINGSPGIAIKQLPFDALGAPGTLQSIALTPQPLANASVFPPHFGQTESDRFDLYFITFDINSNRLLYKLDTRNDVATVVNIPVGGPLIPTSDGNFWVIEQSTNNSASQIVFVQVHP